VDFIIEDQGEIIPLEVKSNFNKASVSKSFRSFLEKYTLLCGYIASHQLYDDVKINDIVIKIVPHWYIDYLDIR
jgi:hypothetical protein